MTIDTDQFWHSLTESRLVELSRIQTLIKEFDAASAATSSKGIATGKTAAKWLLSKKIITSYQSQILLAGQSGPMRFGAYTITARIADGPLKGSFQGRHSAAKFPVSLQFLPGSENSDLEMWNSTEILADRVNSIDHPNIVPLFESVVLPNYRFVVSYSDNGRSLSTIVPRKGRLPWKDACIIMAQVANSLDYLHEQGIIHNAVSPRTIWIGDRAKTKLRMPIVPDTEFEEHANGDSECRHDYLAPELTTDLQQLSAASDFYSLGCTLYRIIAGKTVFPAKDIAAKIEHHRSDPPGNLEKYDLPPELGQLINRLLAKNPADRPDRGAEIGSLLCGFAGKPELLQILQVNNLDAILAFRSYLNSSKIDSIGLALDATSKPVESIVDLVTDVGEKTGAIGNTAIAATASTTIKPKRKKLKWQMPAAIGSALLLMSAVIGLLAYNANQVTLAPPPGPGLSKPAVAEVVEKAPQQAKPPLNARLVQILIEDDDSSLWETPTTGPPLDLSFHPPAPRIVFAFRPAEILTRPEGKLVLQSLGPKLNRRIEEWQQQIGMRLDEMEQLLITSHNSRQSQYDSFVSIRLTQPTPVDDLISSLGRLSAEETGDKILYTRPDNMAFYFVAEPSPSDEAGDIDPAAVSRVIFGKTAIVREVLNSGGLNVLSGTMKNLVEQSDSDRHFSFLFLRPAIFNEQGQTLMSGQLTVLNRQLDLFLQDEIRGGLFSFFIDDEIYFEIAFEQTVDLKSEELATSIAKRLRVLRDQIPVFLASMPSNPYWNKVRLRYDNMLADVIRNLRWDVEFGTVIGNCWLPPMAGHNLIAATELVTAFSSGAAQADSTAATEPIPATLDELLKTRRDLDVTTNPDLNVLLTGIRDEILEEYGSLPFEFQIKLLGNDLQAEGITQNQRPGDFKMIDKSLAEILTEIMIRCNPDKNISGAADPNCKLVWAVSVDPSAPQRQTIVITTRTGAAEKQLKLPPAFQTR